MKLEMIALIVVFAAVATGTAWSYAIRYRCRMNSLRRRLDRELARLNRIDN